MGRYDRFVIVYDPAGSELGETALTLLKQGIDVLFAAYADEAFLLGRQEHERIGALLVSSRCGLDEFDRITQQLTPLPRDRRLPIAVVGAKPEQELLRRLGDRQVGWVLWEPYEPAELRFLVAAALATEDPADPRAGLRVPLRSAVSVSAGPRRVAATLRDISSGGAYLALPMPFALGTRACLELPLGEGSFTLQASVVHRLEQPDADRPDREVGMGLRFEALDAGQATRLDAFIRERIRSFRL